MIIHSFKIGSGVGLMVSIQMCIHPTVGIKKIYISLHIFYSELINNDLILKIKKLMLIDKKIFFQEVHFQQG